MGTRTTNPTAQDLACLLMRLNQSRVVQGSTSPAIRSQSDKTDMIQASLLARSKRSLDDR
jgi:hypothetical protein